MTELSRFWDGTTVGDATLAPYDAPTEMSRVLQSVSGAGGIATNQSAVFRGELNELAVTGASTPVAVNSGRAITGGTWYENNAATMVAIPTPAGATRIDRIVLRKDWATQTVRVTRIAGTEGGAAPALVQIWGTTWDGPLAQASITTGGVITLTDQRQFVGYNAGAGAGSTNTVLVWNGSNAGWSATPTVNTLTAVTTVTSQGGLGFIAQSSSGTSLRVYGSSGTHQWDQYLNGVNLRFSDNTGGGQVIFDTGATFGGPIKVSNSTVSDISANTAFFYYTNPNMRLIGRGPDAATNASFQIITTRSDGSNTIVPFTIDSAGKINIPNTTYVGSSTTNTFMTTGITIQQGGADNEILALKSTDVAHGMTSIAETDTYATFAKLGGADGGLILRGFTETTPGMFIVGDSGTEDTTKSIGALSSIMLQAELKSGTTAGAIGATSNAVVIRNGGNARFIFQGDGTSYEDVGTAWVNYDDHDDIALLTDLSIAASRSDDAIHRRFANFLRYSPEMLQAMDLIHFNADGHHFANRSKIQMALIGASRQLGDRITSVDERVAKLEQENRELRALVGVD